MSCRASINSYQHEVSAAFQMCIRALCSYCVFSNVFLYAAICCLPDVQHYLPALLVYVASSQPCTSVSCILLHA